MHKRWRRTCSSTRAAAREQVFTLDNRPAVYRLALEDGSEFAGAFILAPTGTNPLTGNVMLYSPSEEFEEFENLARLNHTVATRIQDGSAAGKLLIASLPTAARAALNGLPVLTTAPSPIHADVIADSVRALRVRQHFSVRNSLHREPLPTTGELDLAADLTPQLDVANAFMARTLRLLTTEPAWLKASNEQDQARYRQLEQELIDSNEELAPHLEKILTLEAFSQQETDRVLKNRNLRMPMWILTLIEAWFICA